MRIGTASAEPGEKAFGFLKVTNRVDGSDLGFPVIIVNGSEKGPVLLADGAHHGEEYEGCEAILRFVSELEPNKLKGTFIGVPVLNVEAFQAKSRMNPVDPKDLNRIYPGKKSGTTTEQVAYTYLNEVVSKSNYLITCHGGTDRTSPVLFVHCPAWEDNETIKKSIKMAKVFGMRIIRKASKLSYPTYLPASAIERGIPTILVEAGGANDRYANREHYVGSLLKGFKNVSKYLGMLEGTPELPPKQLITSGDIEKLCCKHAGFWIPKTKAGEIVTKGTLLGRIVSPFNIDKELEQIEALHDGVIIRIIASPVVYSGEDLILVGCNVEEITNI